MKGTDATKFAELFQRIEAAGKAIERAWDKYLPPTEGPAGHIGQAARHCLASGKRLRPFLVRLAADTFGLDPDAATPCACAFELLHTATLIHDDLPAIDNADMRRGRPSCHVAFDEPTAILAGDALIVAAFAAMADQASVPQTPPALVLPAIERFASAVQAVILGEAADIRGEKLPPSAELLSFIHQHKTASLIRAAAACGAILAGADPQALQTVDEYASACGLMFQITDDLLDVEGDEAELGKPTGADAQAGKQTYPAVYGVQESRRRARELADRAAAAARRLPANQPIWLALVEFILSRRS